MIDNLFSSLIGIGAMLLAGQARAADNPPEGCRKRKPTDAANGLEACDTLPDEYVKDPDAGVVRGPCRGCPR